MLFNSRAMIFVLTNFIFHVARWNPNMEEEEAKKLVRDAIASGVFNDLGSGSNIDLCVIKKGSVQYLRGFEYANEKGKRAVSCQQSLT